MLGAIALVGACGGSQGTVVTGSSYSDETTYPNETVVGSSDEVPSGTTVWFELTRPLSPYHNRVGDRFTAVAAQDLRSPYGDLLIPRGARVEGTIVDLRPAFDDSAAAIGLRLETLEMAGVRQPLQGEIVRTEIPNAPQRIRGRDVLIGAAAGAILGGLVEGAEGALVGGGLGAGAGALVSLGRGPDRMEELPAGTGIAVRLDRPLRSLASLRGRYY
jgi:hypothetical protein